MKTERPLLFVLLLIVLLAFIVGTPPAVGDETKGVERKEEKISGQDAGALLHRLEKRFSDFTSLKTDFVQEKHLAIFKNKVTLKGRIYLQKPDKVAWHVDKPVRYSVLITDKMIRQWDEDTDKVQEIPLTQNPVFRTVLKQLTAWFSGSYSSLQEDYDVRILQQRPAVVEFTPKEKNFSQKVIRSIAVTFREDEQYLKQIVIRETSGDRTTISFENTLLNIPLEDRFFTIRRRG